MLCSARRASGHSHARRECGRAKREERGAHGHANRPPADRSPCGRGEFPFHRAGSGEAGMESVCRGSMLQGDREIFRFLLVLVPIAQLKCVAKVRRMLHTFANHIRLSAREGQRLITISLFTTQHVHITSDHCARRAAVTRAYCDAGQTTPDLIGFELHATCAESPLEICRRG